MSKPCLEGILIPMPTPFNTDGSVDGGALDTLVEFYISAGVQGLFVLGTHGQAMAMEIEERRGVAEQVVRRVKGRVPIVLHVGTANTFSSVELAKHAASLGVEAIGLVPPYYYPHNDFEIIAHYRRVAEAVQGVPLFIYDNPVTTRVHLTPPKVLNLLEVVPDICGIKVSFSGFEELIQYVRKLPDSVGVFPGSILSLYPGYSLGIRGAIHPPTSPFPEICVKMFQALKNGNHAEAQAVHNRIVQVLGVIARFAADHGRAVFFEAMRLRGLPIRRFPRWECAPFTDQERRDFKETLDAVGIQVAIPF
ncbi:MAG: dihydrodipicolinate synthase family protein [Candidatus Binatia bacterium]